LSHPDAKLDLDALRQRRFSVGQVPGLPEIAVATVLAAVWTVFWYQFVSAGIALVRVLHVPVHDGHAGIVARSSASGSRAAPRLWCNLLIAPSSRAYVSISLGYSLTTRTSVVALLSGAFSLPTIVLARAFLKERVSGLQTAGSVVILGSCCCPRYSGMRYGMVAVGMVLLAARPRRRPRSRHLGSLSGTVAALTDYVARGGSQTRGRPAGQISLEWTRNSSRP